MDSRQRSRRGPKKTYREVEEDEVHEADDDDLEDVQLQLEINENEEEIGEGLVSLFYQSHFLAQVFKK